jgi:tRNA dimethylallyltransferase
MKRRKQQIKMVAIVGPTASGKTALAVELAEKFNGEIVCADSRTVYRGMDIGTAKPTAEQRRRVPHHMLDLIEPTERMTAAEFKDGAQAVIDDIGARGKVPFLVGGSGLYVDAIVFDYQFPGETVYHGMVQLDAMSDHQLQQLLQAEDPEATGRIDLHNRRRVIRAIETAGQEISKNSGISVGTQMLGLKMSKELAQKSIAARIEKMLAEGFIQEVTRLSDMYGWGSEAMTGTGYRAISGALLGSKSMEQAKSDWVRSDLQLWKRQMTWFKRNPAIQWLEDPKAAEPLVAQFLGASV